MTELESTLRLHGSDWTFMSAIIDWGKMNGKDITVVHEQAKIDWNFRNGERINYE